MSATRSRAKRLEMRKRECKRRAEGEYNDRQKYYTLVFIGALASKNPAIIIVALCFYIYHMIKADLKYREKLGECDKLSPLVLDLDGDGVEADALAYFDHEGDGWSELSRWANEDDGVLVWDRNNDGVINDGSELFGNNTVLSGDWKADHGFTALANLDENGDGVVDAKDSDWANLRVMRWIRPGFWGFGESRLVW